jgi:ABC-type branched-subunit amino acid transport system substrate-binding protein
MGGAAQYLQDQGVPVLGIPINNSFYRYSHFFSLYGSPYYPRDGSTVGAGGQLATITTPDRFFRDSLGANKAAVFSYDIAESAQAGDAFEAGLRSEGFSVTRYVVSFAAPSFDAAVADMQRQGTELIFDAMDAGANARLCDAMARRQFTVKAKVMTVPAMGARFGDQFNDACRPFSYVPTDSRPFTDTSFPLAAAYQDGMARYQRGQQLHQWGFEAWIAGSILSDALTAMGPAPTRAGFEQYLMGFRNSDVNGAMTPSIQWAASAPPDTVRDCIGINKWDDAAGGWVSATPFPYCVDDAHVVLTPAAEQGN